jgi:hypothetical protein
VSARLRHPGVAGGRPADSPRSAGGLVLRVLVAVALLVSAYVHVDLASAPYYAAGQLTLGALFVLQAVAATCAAAWVLLRGGRTALAVAALVGLGSLLALVLSVYVRLPSFGPFPVLYEPYWYGPKVLAAVTAAAATAGAVAALVVEGRAARPEPAGS